MNVKVVGPRKQAGLGLGVRVNDHDVKRLAVYQLGLPGSALRCVFCFAYNAHATPVDNGAVKNNNSHHLTFSEGKTTQPN